MALKSSAFGPTSRQTKGFLKRILDYISFAVMSFLAGLFIRTDVIVATSPQFFTAVATGLSPL